MKSKGDEAKVENLKGGENYKINYKKHQEIDIKNPKDKFQKDIVKNYDHILEDVIKEYSI